MKNETIKFPNKLDFFTPYHLEEIAGKITGMQGITVVFEDLRPFNFCAFVDMVKKKIYLPIKETPDPIETDFLQQTKALLYHECAHLMYPDNSASFSRYANQREKWAYELSKTIDDLRIEYLIALIHADIRKDFKYLIDSYWLENYIVPPINDNEVGNGRFGNYSEDLFGSLYWILQKWYRGAELTPPPGCRKILPFIPIFGMELFLEKCLIPLMDPFISSREPAWEAALKIVDLLIKYYPRCFQKKFFKE